jgi:Flp pilus assembly protein TadD
VFLIAHARPAMAAALLLAMLAGCTTLPGDEIGRTATVGTELVDPGRAERLTRLRTMATNAQQAGDHGLAASLYERVVELDPGDTDALRRLGNALLATGDTRAAGEAFAAALRRDPADPQAATGYARALLAVDRADAARAQLEAFIPDSQDPRLLNVAGVATDMLGRHAEARTLYERGLAVAPGDISLTNNLALSLLLDGQDDAAIARLRQLADGPHSTPRARQNLALAYGLKGDLVAAERISRIDLDERSVRANLTTFAALRGGPSAGAARLLAPRAAAAPFVTATTTPPPATGAAPRAADRGPAGAPVELLPEKSTAVGAVAVDVAGLEVGLSPLGDWVVRLGPDAGPQALAGRWRELRRKHPQLLAGLHRLGGAEAAPGPLLIGPFASEAAAAPICAALGAEIACTPIKL